MGLAGATATALIGGASLVAMATGSSTPHPATPSATAKPAAAKSTAKAPPQTPQQLAAAAQRKALTTASAQAKKTGKPVPVASATTERSTVTALPNGHFEADNNVTPQRVKLAGAWTPIDTTLAATANGTLAAKATTIAITFSGGGTGPMVVEDDRAGHTLAISMPVALPKPTVAGDTALYPNVYPGVDLRLTATASGISDLLIVRDAAAAANPALKTLHLAMAGTGVTVSTGADGSVHAKDATGKDRFTSPTPQMWDSTGASPAIVAASRSLTATPAPAADTGADPGVTGKHAAMPAKAVGNGVDLTPDSALMHGSGATFPLFIDPAVGQPIAQNWLEVYQGSGKGYWDGQGYVVADQTVTRVGYNSSSPAGSVRSLLEFSTGTDVLPADALISSAVIIMPHGGGAAGCTPSDQFQLWRTNPIHSTDTWASTVSGSGFVGQTSPVETVYCQPNGSLVMPDTAQFKAMQAGHATATVGVRAVNESRGAAQFGFSVRAASETVAQIYFDEPPGIDGFASEGTNLCGGVNTPVVLPATSSPNYVIDNFVHGDGNGNSLLVTDDITDQSGTTVSFAATGDGSQPVLVGINLNLVNNVEYHIKAHITDTGTGLHGADSSQDCYFLPDTALPAAPSITSANDGSGKPLFPSMGTGKESALTAGAPSLAAFTFASSVSTNFVSVAHYDYALNIDNSKAGPNSGACPAGSQCGETGGGTSVTIDLNSGSTHLGVNYLSVKAVDTIGNTSDWSTYMFYMPAAFAKTVWGNVLGDGIPDIMTILPDAKNPSVSDLVSFPTNHDPSKPSVTGWAGNWIESAPAAAAPDGVSWANTLITHRGADRVVPYDDLFAWQAPHGKNGQLYYYFNTLTGTSNPSGSPVDAFAKTQKGVVLKPPAPACTGTCPFYNATDWSGVKQILAIGPVAGGVPGTFGGKTSLITVEDDNNGNANVWLYKPAGIGQLLPPILISSCQKGVGKGCPTNWNWTATTLVAPGNAAGHPLLKDTAGNPIPNSGLPDLWARDNSTPGKSVMWQFTNRAGDPTSLGDFSTYQQIGAVNQLDNGTWPTLVSDGNVMLDPTGKPEPNPSLWGVKGDGELLLIHNVSANGGAVIPASQFIPASSTTADWTGSFNMNTVDTAPLSPSAGPLASGVSVPGAQLCLDNIGDSRTPGNQVGIWTCAGYTSQAWTFTKDSTIAYTDSFGTLCLDTAGSGSGSGIVVQPCNGSDSQVWRVVTSPTVPGHDSLWNKQAGLCLDDPNAAQASGTLLELFACNDTVAQLWSLPTAAGQNLTAEAETLAVVSSTGETLSTQANTGAVSFSNNGQLLASATAANSTFTNSYYVPSGGIYQIAPAMTKGPDYGTVTVAVDGVTQPNTFDGYAAALTAPAPFVFGTAALDVGWHSFTFTVTGTNPASTGNRYQIGADTLGLTYTHVTAPAANLTLSAASIASPAQVTADASHSAPGGAPISKYSFDFGDGTIVATAAPISHASHGYLWTGTPKQYAITVTVTDGNGNPSKTSQTVTVTAPVGPTAKVDAAATAPVNVPVPVSAATSTPGSANIVTYSVDYGDGSTISVGTAPTTMHTYTKTGPYTITLTETDAMGLKATATTPITIGNQPPVGFVARQASSAAAALADNMAINMNPAKDTSPGNALVVSVMLTNTFYGSVSATDTAGDTFTVVNDISNGSVGHRLVMLAAYKTRGLNLSDYVTVTFAKSGEHQIAVDEYAGIKGLDTAPAGGSTSASTGPATANFNSGNATAVHTGDLIVGIAGIHKTAPPTFAAGYTALPQLQVPTGQTPDYLIAGYQKAPTAGSYASAGTSTGMWMAIAAAFVPNVVTASLAATPTAGQSPLPVAFDAGRSTPGVNPITSYSFDYGDGTAPTTPGTVSTASHTYANAGTYTATVTVTDSTGATDTATQQITATAAQAPLVDNGMIASDANLASATTPTSETSITLTPTADVANNDTLVVTMMLTSSAAIPAGSISISDSDSNTYSQIGQTQADNGGDFIAAFACTYCNPLLLANGDTITVNYPTNKEHHIAVEDFSGVTAVDQYTSATIGTTFDPNHPAFSSGSVQTGAANEILFGYIGQQGGSAATWDPSWNETAGLYANRTDQLRTAYVNVNTTGTYAATGTAHAAWMAGIVTLR